MSSNNFHKLPSLPESALKHCNQLHAGYSNRLCRVWQNGTNDVHRSSDFVLPVFVMNQSEANRPVPSLPGVSQYGYDTLIEYVRPLYEIGLRSLLLFPVMDLKGLDKAIQPEHNPVLNVIPKMKKSFPQLTLLADVCLCAFTEDGHCCVYSDRDTIDDEASVEQVANVALAYARAGIDVVAPSDMNDGRVLAIKRLLRLTGYQHVALMSYSAKFASCLYGPFRDAARSAPRAGTDRSQYQLPLASSALAIRTAERDAQEGADFLMVKPGLFYLDIIRQVVDRIPNLPMAVYQVSGEYSMIIRAAEHDVFDLRRAVLESICAFKRAGAQIIITYFTPHILQWLSDRSFSLDSL